jgi:hypothetical protein
MNKSIKTALFSALILTALPSNGQSCKESITPSTPTSQFTLNVDGTVTDNKTDLTWMRCSFGQTWNAADSSCTGNATSYEWGSALAVAAKSAAKSDFEDPNDWRLPNVKELSSIAELSCESPAINESIFPNIDFTYVYWSSSTYVHNSGFAYGTGFYRGQNSAEMKSENGYVRLVRIRQ